MVFWPKTGFCRGRLPGYERDKRASGLMEVERAVEDAKRREMQERSGRLAGGKVTDIGRARGEPSRFILVSGCSFCYNKNDKALLVCVRFYRLSISISFKL